MTMTSYQRASRFARWRGGFLALSLCSAWMLVSAYAGSITS